MKPEAPGELAVTLALGAERLGVDLTPAQRDRLIEFLALLQRWNRVYNLTAVRDPSGMVGQHLLDCLAVVPPLRRQTGGRPVRVLDVGSGAGLPGIVLAVAMPELDITCVDTVGKKASFIRQAAGELGLQRVQVRHARVELLDGPGFGIIVSRAFASLGDFTSSTRRQFESESGKAAGVWLAMKGKVPTDELAALPAAVRVFHVEQFAVPAVDAERCLVWMRPADTDSAVPADPI